MSWDCNAWNAEPGALYSDRSEMDADDYDAEWMAERMTEAREQNELDDREDYFRNAPDNYEAALWAQFSTADEPHFCPNVIHFPRPCAVCDDAAQARTQLVNRLTQMIEVLHELTNAVIQDVPSEHRSDRLQDAMLNAVVTLGKVAK